MPAKKIYTSLLWIQAVYTLLTAVWPLIHIESFMWVTGPKTDVWLVKTVSLLLLPITIVFFSSIYMKMLALPVILVGISSAAGLGFIDFYYTAKDVIKWVYAVDGVLQVIFLLTWLYLLRINRRLE